MDLLVQGPILQSEDRGLVLRELETLTGTKAIPTVDGRGARLRLHGEAEAALTAARALHIPADLALVPAERRLGDFRILAMDMDSTLITIECIDELAELAGIGPRVASVTARAMRGEIPFAESLRLRAGLLANLPVTALEKVYAERLELSEGAEALIAAARAAGLCLVLVSGGFTWFTERLARRMGFDRTHANELEIRNGLITGQIIGPVLDGAGKAEAVRSARIALDAPREQVIVIGDGANDLPMMAEAGVSIAYHAKPVVRAKADYSLDYSGLDGVLNLLPIR
jgi:phosphoserine phosphatase